MNGLEYLKTLSSIKLVIGNGFDLNRGLKTSYTDFFNWRKNSWQVIRTILGYAIKCGQMSSGSDTDKIIYQILLSSDFRSNEQEFLKLTIWDIYFCFMEWDLNPAFDNWYEVEKQIKRSLLVIEEHQTLPHWDRIFKKMHSIHKENEDYEALFYYKFIKSFKNIVALGNRDAFYHMLHDELVRFEHIFGEFVNEKSIEVDPKCLAANERLSWLSPSIDSIDSFNYTDMSHFNVPIKHYINGDYTAPIFGIDSKDVDGSDPRFVFTKTYRRMENFMKSGTAYYGSHFHDLIIYGHSLNEQDYNYFFPIFDMMDLPNPNENKRIVFAYSVFESPTTINQEEQAYITEDASNGKLKGWNIGATANSLYIEKVQRENVVRLIDAYEEYKTERKTSHRLLDRLTQLGKISLIKVNF